MGWIFALACWMRILCLLWKMMHIYNNVITCIFWCKLLDLFKHWYMSCDYTAFVIRPYDKCRIIVWQMSHNRYNCFLASYKSQHCYHPSHPWQFAGEVCDEAETIYYTFGPEIHNYSFWMSKNDRNYSFWMNKNEDLFGCLLKKSYFCK